MAEGHTAEGFAPKRTLHVWNPSDARRVLCGATEVVAYLAPEFAEDGTEQGVCSECMRILRQQAQTEAQQHI